MPQFLQDYGEVGGSLKLQNGCCALPRMVFPRGKGLVKVCSTWHYHMHGWFPCSHIFLATSLCARCSVAWSPDRNPVDPDVAAGMSTGFIAQLHDFALGFPGARPSCCGPDEYAVPCLNSSLPLHGV